MKEFMFWFGFAANVITVLAGLIAIAGVAWAIAGRAKLTVKVSVWPSLTPSLDVLATSSGSNPVRNLTLAYGAVDDSGFSMWGTAEPAFSPLDRGASVLMHAFDEGTTHFGSPLQANEVRVGLQRGDGLFITVQWQSPLFPWRRKSVTYVWPPHLRFAGAEPERLTGRAEIRFLERARDPKSSSRTHLSPSLPAQAQIATDATFDDLVSEHSGPVVVGLAPSWQDEFWEDVQRMLSAFAAKHSPRVRVLTVTTDRNPLIADRYTDGVFPHFIILDGGAVQASKDGVSSMADLESAFQEHLR